MKSKQKNESRKRGPGRILLRILSGLLVVILLGLASLYIIPLTERVGAKTADHSADWMSLLNDDLRLNELVLPGTHDSATQYVQLAFFSKCQALSIGEQLEAGYRYLDIRLGMDENGLKLMHGFTNCKTGALPWDGALRLETVLEQCYAFLEAHPTETVIFAVKQEHGGETAAAFAMALEAIIARDPERWYLGGEIPTLGEARGRLVLFRRYDVDEAMAGISMLWPNQNGHADVSRHTEMTDNGAYRLWVQDRYEYDTEDKWKAFLSGLEEIAVNDGDLSVNFLSTKGTFAYGHPFAYAKTLNLRLSEISVGALRGWIVVDFGDAGLASHIWSANLR